MKSIKHKWGILLFISSAVSLISVSCLVYLLLDIHFSGQTIPNKEISKLLEISLSDKVKILGCEYHSLNYERLRAVLDIPSDEFKKLFLNKNKSEAKIKNNVLSIFPKRYREIFGPVTSEDIKSFRYKNNNSVVDLLYYNSEPKMTRVYIRWSRRI